MAKEELKTSILPVQPVAEETTTIIAMIAGIGPKKMTVPFNQVEKALEKIAKIGFPVDIGEKHRAVYPSSRIERLDVKW
jgi:hypothetical protein